VTTLKIVGEWLLVMAIAGWLAYRIPYLWAKWTAALRRPVLQDQYDDDVSALREHMKEIGRLEPERHECRSRTAASLEMARPRTNTKIVPLPISREK